MQTYKASYISSVCVLIEYLHDIVLLLRIVAAYRGLTELGISFSIYYKVCICDEASKLMIMCNGL